MHPVLLPGTHVLRRGAREWQVGLSRDPVVLAGSPPQPHDLGRDPRLLTRLVAAGLAAPDDRPVREAVPGQLGDLWVRHTMAALVRQARERLPDVLARRRRVRVAVVPFGHPIAGSLGADTVSLLRRTGLAVRAGPAARARDGLTVRLLVGVGEPARDLLDPLVRSAVPHLLVRLTEGCAVVGPFVVPGSTACLRCLDAYRREEDPSWPLLVEQYARATRGDRADGIPEPVDAALAAVAVGWAVRDVATYAEGDRPVTLSATVTFGPLLDRSDHREWPPHPHCGCGW